MNDIKRNTKNLFLSSIIIFSLFLLSACGAKVNTEMRIDKNFKGERIKFLLQMTY